MADRRAGRSSGLTPENGERRRSSDRRKKQDWVVRSVTIIAALGWILALTALMMIDRASPAQEDLFTRVFDVTVVSYWNTSLLRSAFAATLASFVVCVIGIIANIARHRRKTDRFNKLLITISAVSTVIFVLYLVNYSQYL